MSSPGTDPGRSGGGDRPRVGAPAAAEAAVWVARLHGPNRSHQMERECLAWQAQSAENREAFERCTETWQDLAGLSVADAYASDVQPASRASEAWFARRWAPALALVVVAACGGLLFQGWRSEGVYRTAIGEQQRVVLDDGTRVTLNTDTRVGVNLGHAEREAELDHGEALFEVAKDPQRPFVVHVGGTAVVAHGTTFTVRYTSDVATSGQSLAITLLDGQVSVQAWGKDQDGVAPDQTQHMLPGDRVRLARPAGQAARSIVPALDRPNLEQVVAWQRNEAVFDDAPLAAAVLEMNRYSRTPIVLLEPGALGSLRVSGLFRVGESAGFARAVAALHGLTLKERQGRLELAKPH